MLEEIERYKSEGFQEIKTDSGTGSRVFINEATQAAVKINQDPAYDKFVELIQKNLGCDCFPKIFLHEKPVGDFVSLSNEAYSVTEMELLFPLSEDEQETVLAWIERKFERLKSGDEAGNHGDDPYDLTNGFGIIHLGAICACVSLDVLKGSNFMVRVQRQRRRIVFTDPFN